jgi:hypothetical protein
MLSVTWLIFNPQKKIFKKITYMNEEMKPKPAKATSCDEVNLNQTESASNNFLFNSFSNILKYKRKGNIFYIFFYYSL